MKITLTQQEIDIIESDQTCKVMGWSVKKGEQLAFDTFECEISPMTFTNLFTLGKIVGRKQLVG